VDDSRLDEWVARTSGRLALYAAMLAGTLGGQLLGIGASVALGLRAPALPVACSVVLEALAGARASGARQALPLGWRASLRVSTVYSLALVLVTIPLLLWTAISLAYGRNDRPAPALQLDFGSSIVFWVGVWLVAGTLLRAALMRVFSPRTP
jgi:hypothetical protein